MKNNSEIMKANILELTWADLKQQVRKLNPELAEAIDQVDPGPQFKIFKAKYPFGAEILQSGSLAIPNPEGKLVAITDNSLDKKIQHKLNYNLNSNPVSFVLKNSVEVVMLLENATVPLYGLIGTGKLFGTWHILNPTAFQAPVFLWTMTAGARSLFLLPKIAENLSYTRLRKAFHLSIDKPKKMRDHWQVFREIANHPDFNCKWETEILFFAREWFENLNDPAWTPFKLYLLDRAWKGSEYFRNEFMWDLIFSNIQSERSIKPDAYIADTVRHLLGISIGALPGFAPALNDDAGPIIKLQEVFDEIYRLDYAPIIMQPTFLNEKKTPSVYYSLEYPTTLKFSPKTRSNTSKINELYDTKSLLEKYLADIKSNKYNVSGTLTFKAIEQVKYEFFHPDNTGLQGIQSTQDIQKGDPAFANIKRFPLNSAFLAGSIRLMYKSENTT